MALITFVSSLTERTLRYLMYVGSSVLVAFTENNDLSLSGYGNSESRVISIGVFKTGEALLGFKPSLAETPVLVLNYIVWVTVTPLITTTML
jgi:hypothetical protein